MSLRKGEGLVNSSRERRGEGLVTPSRERRGEGLLRELMRQLLSAMES